MKKFVLLVEFQVKPESLARFNEMINVNASASVQTEPGCRQFDVTHAADDPCHVFLYEVYDDEAAFSAHMGMSHTKTFLDAAKAMITKQTATRLTRLHAPRK
mgnify:CR=1 FL=1